MPTTATIFRPYSSSDSLRSDRSAGDRQRHRKKVRESIRENIADMIAEESIIGKDKDKIIKVPIRGVKEYRFIYGENAPGVGQGDGNSQPGQVIGKSQGEGRGQGQDKAGNQPGVDYYETDVTLEELIEIMFEDLELPDMERKILREVMSERIAKPHGTRKVGIRAWLKKRNTMLMHIRGNVASLFSRLKNAGYPEQASQEELDVFCKEADEDIRRLLEQFYVHDKDIPGMFRLRRAIHKNEQRYRYMEPDIRPESNAVVFLIMDTSGSMDTMKKYLARSFFFLLYQFVCTKYQNVKVVFIAYHTEAKEVTEEEFFHKGESGGTFISSGQNKALEIIQDRYHPTLWNLYAFLCSDGDNFESDNPATVKATQELCKVCNLVGYGEIKPLGSRYYESSMLNILRRIEADNYKQILIERKEDIWPSFKAFLAKERPK
ncbi:MAG: hypothetical protein G01um101429_784 [Parcubacteria group bacterium Gr01-1014_29]|nr:MAG: hypothetical protein G01um101429_784 [Parcubacteria group bacterium Gr01-1014_29]